MKNIQTIPNIALPLQDMWRRFSHASGLSDFIIRQRVRREEKINDPKCREAFAQAAGTDVDTFMALATAGMPELKKKALTHDLKKLNAIFEIEYEGEGYSDTYKIDFSNNVVETGLMQSDRGDRRTGRRMFAQRAAMGLYLGFDTMFVDASLEMGGYVWARAGVFVIKDYQKILTARMTERLKQIKHRIDPQIYEHAAQLIHFKRDTDLDTITRLPTMLTNVDAIWNGVRNLEEQYPVWFKDYRKRKVVRGRDMTLGQYLTLGLHYLGYINLHDRAQMETVEKYTGVPIRATAASYKTRYPRQAAPL